MRHRLTIALTTEEYKALEALRVIDGRLSMSHMIRVALASYFGPQGRNPFHHPTVKESRQKIRARARKGKNSSVGGASPP